MTQPDQTFLRPRGSEMSAPNRSGLRTALLAGSLAAVVLLVYWRTLFYPFVQDDWAILQGINVRGAWGWLVSGLLPSAGAFFRPLACLYLVLQWELFGLSPLGYHLTALVLHIVNSLLVASVVSTLTGDRRIGVTAGFLNASAAVLFLDPLSWVVGCYDLLGALFFFLSVRLYLGGRTGLSVLGLVAALLSKEATVILPVVLFLAGFMRDGRGRPGIADAVKELRSLRYHLAVMATYIALWLGFVRPAAAVGGEEAYAVSFAPGNLLGNLAAYVRWCLEYLHPWMHPSMAVWTGVLGLLVCVFLSFALRRTQAFWLVLLALSWFIAGLLPALPLLHHGFRYYLAYSFPAFGVIIGLLIRTAAGKRREAVAGIMLILVVFSVVTAYRYTRELEALGFNTPTLDGSNNLSRKAVIVTMVRSYMISAYPILPERSLCIFDWVPTIAFSKDAGPQLWYSDTTLHVYEIQELGEDTLGIYPVRPDGRRSYLRPSEAILFEFHGDVLRSQVLFRDS